MHYRITKPTIGYTDFIEISSDEFEAGKAAKRNLVEVLSIEEKFNLVLENYAEFERELLNLSLNRMMFSDHNWFSFQIDTHSINRRLINLLTTCRLYVDHIPQDLNSISGNVLSADVIKRKMSDEYDSSLSYRVLEALRNYVQHRGLPIYGLSYEVSREETVSGITLKHTISPTLSVSKLKEEKKFKTAILNELEAIGDRVDIKPFVRQYIDSLGQVHLFLRESLKEHIDQWDSAIAKIQNRFREVIDDDVKLLSLEARDSAGKVIESLYIFSEIIEHRQWLVRKNRTITHFSSDIISSEVRTADA